MKPDVDLTPADLSPEESAPPAMPPKPDPTRYGDWTLGGRCIDF